MLALLLAVAVASPSPSPSAQPLQIIITVHNTPWCTQFADQVNSVIADTVNNDMSLGSAITTLHSSDIKGNPLEREHELMRLRQIADAMYKSYRDGEAEVNRLRALAKSAKSDDEKKEVKGAADAIGGALYRQHLIQRDLDGFLAYLDAGDMRHIDADTMVDEPATGSYIRPAWLPGGRQDTDVEQPGTGLAGSESPMDDFYMAGKASTDFGNRLGPILSDELNAGAHITEANNRCE